MGRDTGPVCRKCRREGMQLFLKGNRCFTAKCPVTQGTMPPGMHGGRRRKVSDYGQQLREKQRLRAMYGMREGPFRRFFAEAQRKRGVTGEALLQMLEMRLDTVVHRLGFSSSRAAARQFVLHGHIAVNGRTATIPSMQLKANDTIQVRARAQSQTAARPIAEEAEARGIAKWLALDKENLKGMVLRIPSREDINPVVNEQQIVELYSK